jgi:hypothetical protein
MNKFGIKRLATAYRSSFPNSLIRAHQLVVGGPEASVPLPSACKGMTPRNIPILT